MKRSSGNAQQPAHQFAISSAERPAHHSSNVESTMAPLATHSVSYSAQQLEVLQCLDKEGWLVTPLLNGCRIAVLSRACKQALEGWPSRLQCLEFLRIYGDLEVARKLQWVAQHCPQLRYLVLDYCYPSGGNLSEAIQAVAGGCSRLRHLDFGGNFATLEATLQAVAQACPELECLCVAYCDVTDAALWAVAQGCPQLKELDLSLNWVSNAAIQAVAQACPQLKKLNVTYCTNLRDEAIDAVARGCPQLEYLQVVGLRITDAAIHAVAQGCPQLKQLDMSQCELLTESAIKSIERGCSRLECLKHCICGRAVHIQYGYSGATRPA